MCSVTYITTYFSYSASDSWGQQKNSRIITLYLAWGFASFSHLFILIPNTSKGMYYSFLNLTFSHYCKAFQVNLHVSVYYQSIIYLSFVCLLCHLSIYLSKVLSIYPPIHMSLYNYCLFLIHLSICLPLLLWTMLKWTEWNLYRLCVIFFGHLLRRGFPAL